LREGVICRSEEKRHLDHLKEYERYDEECSFAMALVVFCLWNAGIARAVTVIDFKISTTSLE